MRFASAVALVLLAVLSGCGSSAELRALRAEPLADLGLDSAERVAAVERDAGQQLGKPQGAVVQLTFRPAVGATVDDVLQQARAAAADDGWQLTEPSPSDVSTARRPSSGRTHELAIYPSGDGDVVVRLATT